LLGAAYMAAIRPARHLVVYPRMLKQLGRDWRARGGRDLDRTIVRTSPTRA
jgi:hypothetical protein